MQRLDISNISGFIRKTNPENPTINPNELTQICDSIRQCTLTNQNIHIIIKLISNIYNLRIDNPSFNINFERFITFCSDDIMTDGDVISFVNIYCSTRLNQYGKAIKLINKFSVHKTSSYIPVFNYLIKTKQYEALKSFYDNYIVQNQLIDITNREIKEKNQSANLYNPKIKLMGQKFQEFIKLTSELKLINHPANTISNIIACTSHIDGAMFNEITLQNEQNKIIIPNKMINDIILLAIENHDHDFIHRICQNIKEPTSELVLTLSSYAIEHNVTHINAGRCCKCGEVIHNNILTENNRINILSNIEQKVLSITHDHNIYRKLNRSEIMNIATKWNEFKDLLSKNDFDIVVDGANLGYLMTKGNKQLNIKFIKTIISNIVSETNKKILLVFHRRHTHELTHLTFHPQIAQNIMVYMTPNYVNDDLFWLYGTLYCKCFILTNDQGRDLACMISYQNEITQWMKYYQINAENPIVHISKKSVMMPGVIVNENNIHVILNDSCICIHTRNSTS